MTSDWRVIVAVRLASALIVIAPPLLAPANAAQPPQQTRTPPRDAAPAQHTGTAILRGRVVAADSGRPLRRARVSVAGEGLGADGRRATSTNLDGRYEFKDLPAARYRISVTRGGYLPLDYGQRRPGEQGRPVQLADGGTLEKIDFALPRMGIITGHVTDESGEPVEGVHVYPMRALFYEGRRRLVPVNGWAETDDAGEYRLTRLAPGTYYVMATTKETWTVTENGKETTFGYVPTYFPGVGATADARAVAVGIGRELPGMDVSLVPGRAAKVSGIALDSQGRPFSRVSLSEEIRGLNFGSFGGGPDGPVAADGTFSMPNVPPGTYTIQTSRQASEGKGDPEVALMTLDVQGVDIENVVLTGSNGGTVSGRVVSETDPLPKTGVRVLIAEALRTQPSPVLLGTFSSSRGGGEIKEDGTFSVSNVFGHARFQVAVPAGWMLKSITYEGRDLTERPLELKSGESITGVEVLITNRITTMSGQVVDQRGAPVGDATVLLFAADANRWFESSRSVRAARPDQQGQWELKGLPNGEYLAIALEYIEDTAWNDPEYLESLRDLSQKVALEEGASRTVSLKLVTPK